LAYKSRLKTELFTSVSLTHLGEVSANTLLLIYNDTVTVMMMMMKDELTFACR